MVHNQVKSRFASRQACSYLCSSSGEMRKISVTYAMGTACHWLFANTLHGDACAGWMLYLHYPHQHFHRCRLQRMDPTIQACLFNNCNCCHMQFFFRILPTSHCDWMRRRTPQPRHRHAYSRRERVARWHAYACHSVVTAARSRVCDELSSTG